MNTFRNCQRGITMIELMISMLLGVVLLGGLVQILSSTKQSYRLQESLSRLQENGRFAMNFITRDVRMAGFLGCRRISDVVPVSVAKPVLLVATANNVISGTDGITSSWVAPNNAASPDNPCGATNLCIAGTDAITMIRAASCGANLTAAMASVAATIPIPATNTCAIAVGDPLIIADCANSDIFRADSTGINVTRTATSNTSVNLSKVYTTSAELYTYNAFSYFIRRGAGGVNSLWRYDNNRSTAVELVEGIENMQILYGADIQAPQDGNAEYYVASGFNPAQVVSVRISLLVISTENNLVAAPLPYFYNGATITPPDVCSLNGVISTTAPPCTSPSVQVKDLRIRRVFTSTIAIRNLLR